ncbi:MAG: hypothetical protein GY788_22375 [bacterium]|nr:hypothetical protein [bacterium]
MLDTLTADGLRSTIVARCDVDPGPLRTSMALPQLRLSPLQMLQLLNGIEDEFEIEFPTMLLSVLGTVDDLLYYTNVKARHE